MKALKYLLFILLFLFIASAIYVGVQPNTFEVSRSKTIKAPVTVVFNEVSNLEHWKDWSSWIQSDPEIQLTMGEVTKGLNASYSWVNKDGEGKMTTTAVEKNVSLDQEMIFGDFPPSKIHWDFSDDKQGGTNVTWSINGNDLPFTFKAILAISGGAEKNIGPEYERSLENLDQLILKSMSQFNIEIKGITTYGGGYYMYKTTSAASDNISLKMGQQFGAVMGYMGQNGVAPIGMPLTVYHTMDMENGNVIMSNGLPVQNKIETSADSEVLCGFIPNTKAVMTVLHGNYTNLSQAWAETLAYIKTQNIVTADIDPFEIYTTDPALVPNPANWETVIYVPIKD
ncbi:MAG: transcription activator effector-binding protein [Bacteroidetes bacterium MedPE-SWsnd-G2]|nr:MAG: transcription activator effector-binding protein [Bacteroidetes bacterium MedPE-SWsnd-G2]